MTASDIHVALHPKQAKVAYRELCGQESSIPIFSRAWWLDAVCGDDWDVCLVEKGGRVVAAMPYHYRKNRLGLLCIAHPPLTQTLGPWLRPSGAKYATRLGQEKDLLTALIDQLPNFAHFQQNWHHTNTNWLPFYWRGFQQSTRYTYRLDELSDLDAVWKGFRENIRTDIRKAINRFKLTVRTDATIDDFLALNVQTFERQGMNLPYPKASIQKLDMACATHDARKTFIAEDEQGQHHAGVYLIWDEQSAYYLMGGGASKLRNSGAHSLLMWEAIKFAATVSKTFDFEGSMIEAVERNFRAFGARQVPYHQITRINNRWLKAGWLMREAIRVGIKGK